MAHCDQEGVKEQSCAPITTSPIDGNISTSQQDDDHEGDRAAVPTNKYVPLKCQNSEEDGEREIDRQKCALQHLSELACQIQLERVDKHASTNNGNNMLVFMHEATKNNLHVNKNAQNSPNSEGVEDFALPLWVKWRGKWQTGIRCPRGDCPSLTLSAKPTHDRKTYIAVFFPRSKAHSWVDTVLVRPIDDSPTPLVNGNHRKWRKMVHDMNIPRSYALQQLALAMLNLIDSLHSQAVIEDARKTETWRSFAREASFCKSYADLGEMLVKFCNMILPDYISSNWLKDSFDSWVQRCRSAASTESLETLMKELGENVLWQEMCKLYNGFMQPELAPEWKTIKQDVTKWFAASREETKRPISDKPVSPESQISRKRPKLEIRRASTSSAPHPEKDTVATTPVNTEKHVEVIKSADSATTSTATLKGYTYRQCAAFIEAKGRQCERWANDGDIYCCVHLNVRVDAYDRRAPHPEKDTVATTPVNTEKQVEVIKSADSASTSTATPKGYTYRQCAAFIEAKGRQCERWASDGDIYCCVHLNVRVDAYDRRAPVDAPLCHGTTTNGTNCKHRAKPGSVFCKKHRFQTGTDSANVQTNITLSSDIISFSNKLQDCANSPLSQRTQSSAGPSTSAILSPTFGQTATLIEKKPDNYYNTIASPTNTPRPSPKPPALASTPTATHALPLACNSSSAVVVSSSSLISVSQCIGERVHPHEAFSECQEAAKKFDLYCQNHIPKFLKRARDGRRRPITKEVIIKLFKSCMSRQEKLLVHRACELLYSFLKSKTLIRRPRLDSTDQTDLITSVVSKDPEVGQYLLKLISSEKDKLASICGLGTDLNPLPGYKFSNTNIAEQGEGSKQNVGKLMCKLCFQEFFDDQKLGLHWKDVHKREARSLFRGYACAVCMEGFNKRKVLESHVQEKHGSVQAVQQSTLFRCMSCNCHFPRPDQLWQHVLSSHVAEFTATGTEANYTNSVVVPSNQISDDSSKKLTCMVCGLKFDLLADLGQHHQVAHMDDKASAGSASYTHRRGKYQINRNRHLFNPQQPSFKFKKNQTTVKNSIKLTISNQNLVQESVDTEANGLRQLTDEECSKVAEALFSDIHKSKPHPSNSDILSVACSTCCKINLIAELEAKYGSLPENIYLKAAKLCSETDTRIEWHREGFVCPKGCKAIEHPPLRPLNPIGEPLAQMIIDFEEDEYHVVLDSKHFGWSLKRDGVVLLCGDVSFGKEKVTVPCVVDKEIRDSLEGEESLADGILMPWNEFTYVTERVVDPSLSDSGKDQVLGCGCVKEKCSQESCDHVYLFDNDYENAMDKSGKPMLGKFAIDKRGLIVLEEGYPVYECNSSCKCNSSCQNRVLQNGINVKLEVFRTKSKGWGVRAVEAIPRGTFVCEYIGEVVTGEQASERRERQSKDGCQYLCEIGALMGHAGGNCVEPMPCVIDASKYGNVARFINHSCCPNLSSYLVLVESMDCQVAHVGLFANQDINVGEELVFDYRSKEKDALGQP